MSGARTETRAQPWVSPKPTAMRNSPPMAGALPRTQPQGWTRWRVHFLVQWLVLACLCLVPWASSSSWAAPANPSISDEDPLKSVRWKDLRRQFFSGATVVFDDPVQVQAPVTAENPLQVPISVDASALQGVQEVVVFADLNPIVEVLRFYPQAAKAKLSFRIKLQQSTPVRAAARTADGVWHLGGTWVNTAGGGCTAPSFGSANPAWLTQLNDVSGRQWSEGPNAGRMRMRIVHPMDTGLVSGIPAFFLENLEFRDAATQELLMRVKPFEPVSENPVFTLERASGSGPVVVSGRDNNGNPVASTIAP